MKKNKKAELLVELAETTTSTEQKLEQTSLALSLAQAKIAEQKEVMAQIEKLVDNFLLERFQGSAKPKKFLWWSLLNADVVYKLITEIIKLIKNLKDKYNEDSLDASKLNKRSN